MSTLRQEIRFAPTSSGRRVAYAVSGHGGDGDHALVRAPHRHSCGFPAVLYILHRQGRGISPSSSPRADPVFAEGRFTRGDSK
ncbi:hypothetical protein M6I34_11990 [Burkholderiaceae bacterium FT117]|uniref:hypothetical protein n=1 Tax=Zeimonas sediminis TaxID=2944268 RepID=UPI00234312C3|nr:hypothetical protein [Zeimonas sediminis]MCM5571228.1 hypothetical protein [Zeimonas sediminis]